MNKSDLSNKTILYLVHSYASFQKDQIEILSKSFKEVIVLVRYKPISELGRFFPLPFLKVHQKNFSQQSDEIPDNVTVISAPLWYLPTNRSYLKLGEKHFKKVVSIIRKYKINFDLIHSHFAWSAGYVGKGLKDKYDVPFILTTHRYDIIDLPNRSEIWKRKIKDVVDSADRCITVSNINLDHLSKISSRSDFHVIVNGFKPIFENRVSQSEPDNKKTIALLNVAMLHKRKGHVHLIEAIKILSEDYDIRCNIVGDGSLRNKLQKRIDNYGLGDKVFLLGRKMHNQVAEYMKSCDLFVLPSFSEGNPTVMFEALGAGKPYIGTAIGGVPEIINSDDYGYLCDPGNSEDLASIIKKGIERHWDTAKIQEYSKQFRWTNICKQIEEVYKDVITEL